MAALESESGQEDAAHPYQGEYQKENNESNGFPVLSSPPFFQLGIPVWEHVTFHCIVLEKNEVLRICQDNPEAFDVTQTQGEGGSCDDHERWEYGNLETLAIPKRAGNGQTCMGCGNKLLYTAFYAAS
jgi:hypothetical protein